MTGIRFFLIGVCSLMLGWAAPLRADLSRGNLPDRAVPASEGRLSASADAIDQPLTGQPGDATKGRALVLGRQTGLCVLCHSGPFTDAHFQGTLAPDLGQSAAYLSAGQLRAHIVEPQRFNPSTIMPSYLRSEGLTNVAPSYQGKSILLAQDVEDVIAFLLSLKP